MKGKDEIMEDTGNGKMIVITGGKVKDANVLVDRIAKLTATHYLRAFLWKSSRNSRMRVHRIFWSYSMPRELKRMEEYFLKVYSNTQESSGTEHPEMFP